MKDFTLQELRTFEKELRAFRIPKFSQIINRLWIKFGKYTITPIVSSILLGLFGYITPNINKSIIITFLTIMIIILFGISFLVYLSDLLIEWKITTTAQKLGLDSEEWDYLIELFNINILYAKEE